MDECERRGWEKKSRDGRRRGGDGRRRGGMRGEEEGWEEKRRRWEDFDGGGEEEEMGEGMWGRVPFPKAGIHYFTSSNPFTSYLVKTTLGHTLRSNRGEFRGKGRGGR